MTKYSSLLRTAPGVPSYTCKIKLGSPDLSCPPLTILLLWPWCILFTYLFPKRSDQSTAGAIHLVPSQSTAHSLGTSKGKAPGDTRKPARGGECPLCLCFAPREPQEPGRACPPLQQPATLEGAEQGAPHLASSPTAKGHAPVLCSPYSEQTSLLEAMSSDCFLVG